VRTIVGTATSVTALLGRARRGPINTPVVINNYGDFERRFGGLWNESTLGFAVRDYFLNGGQQGVIVRLFNPHFATEEDRLEAFTAAQTEANTAATGVSDAAAGAVAGAAGPADVAAAAEGAVAGLGAVSAAAMQAARAVADAAVAAAAVTGATPQDVADAAAAAVTGAVQAAANAAAPVTRARLSVGALNLQAASEGTWGNELRARVDHSVTGPEAAILFNLSIRDGSTGDIEVIRNVSVAADHPRRVDRVLQRESRLVSAFGALPAARPAASAAPAVGADPFGPTTSSGVTIDASDGDPLVTDNYLGSQTLKTGMYALEDADIFNLLCIPPYTAETDVAASVWTQAATYCEQRRAMVLVDAPSSWVTKDLAVSGMAAGVGTTSKNAALYFPRLRQPNVIRDNQIETFAPCGTVAGVIARTDAERGVWKAPAGLEAVLRGVPQLSVPLTDAENGELNPLGVNCLRAKPPAGRIVWGARTLQGDDRLASEWKYLSVRRTALYIEESLFRGTQWVVFEPNDEPLWAQIRLSIGSFMHGLFRQGAFQGSKPQEAYLVKVDRETTTQDDINRGIVNIIVGFAPLKPAEFVIIKLQQLAGQSQA
jgi:phage tail sheath protein FI